MHLSNRIENLDQLDQKQLIAENEMLARENDKLESRLKALQCMVASLAKELDKHQQTPALNSPITQSMIEAAKTQEDLDGLLDMVKAEQNYLSHEIKQSVDNYMALNERYLNSQITLTKITAAYMLLK